MDRAQPGARGSTNRNIEFGETTSQFSDGWIVPADDPTLSAQRYTSLDETAFNEFDATYSGDSLTVIIAPGEAFVDGWLARDVTTDITLDADTAGQTIVIGWDPDAIYDDHQHDVRDEADRVMIALANDVVPTHPSVGIWEFDTDIVGVTAARDNRNIGPTLSRESVNSDTLHLPSILAANPDRFQAAQLDDGESYEVPIQVPDGNVLEVYRWGAYDTSDNTAPPGLRVELLDGDDVVQQSETTANTQNETTPIAAHTNTAGSERVFTLRGKNDTGGSIGDAQDHPGVGMHFGYRVR
jgi:hypothetical protein